VKIVIPKSNKKNGGGADLPVKAIIPPVICGLHKPRRFSNSNPQPICDLLPGVMDDILQRVKNRKEAKHAIP